MDTRHGARRTRDRLRARGRRRLPAAAAARVARDQAHLVAQHRAAGGSRLRGDRARPARLRRLGARTGRLLRPGRARAATCTRSCTTCSATSAARRPAATVGGVVIQDLGLRFAGFVVRQCLFNTVAADPDRAVRAGGHPEADSRRRSGWRRRLLPPPGARRRRPRGRARHAGQAPPLHRAVLRLRGSGPHPAAFTAEDVDFMTEPFADAEKLRVELRDLRDRDSATATPSELPRFFETQPGADTGAVRTRGPRHLARLPRALRGRLHRADRPAVVPRAGHFLQWERADVLNQSLIYFFADLRS